MSCPVSLSTEDIELAESLLIACDSIADDIVISSSSIDPGRGSFP